jgi:cytochrome c-type protein NapC
MQRVKQTFKDFWAIATTPTVYFSLGFLTLGGFFGGVIFLGGFNVALEASNTEAFCISCHEMRANPYEELQNTVHFVNRTGIRATCADCHVPKEWRHKVVRKVQATKELWGHLFGRINTPEKFEAHRLEMAVVVWSQMKRTNSRECRNCHEKVWMDLSMQFEFAQTHHTAARENDLTCIDCHQGIAHRLPETFVPPTLEELIEKPREWLAEAEAAAKQRD